MKNLITFIFLLFTASILAQNYIGLRGGVFLAKQDYRINGRSKISDFNIGVESGMMARWPLFKKMYFQPEVTFIQKGSSLSNRIVKINQLQFTTMLGYEIRIKSIFFHLNTGAFLGRVIGLPKDEDPYAAAAITLSSKDENWDWGFVNGICMDTKIGKGRLGVESRFHFSGNYFRTTIQGVLVAGSIPSASFLIKLKNRGWGFNLTYRVPLVN